MQTMYTIAQELQFSGAKNFGKIPIGSLQTLAPNPGGMC